MTPSFAEVYTNIGFSVCATESLNRLGILQGMFHKMTINLSKTEEIRVSAAGIIFCRPLMVLN